MKAYIISIKIALFAAFAICFSSAQICSICEGGAVPRDSDVLLKFFPGLLPQAHYTCKELYFLGLYNDGTIITPEICHSLIRLASFSCGCGDDEEDQSTKVSMLSSPQDMDVTVAGTSNDTIFSSHSDSTGAQDGTFMKALMSPIIGTGTTPTVAPSPEQDLSATPFQSSFNPINAEVESMSSTNIPVPPSHASESMTPSSTPSAPINDETKSTTPSNSPTKLEVETTNRKNESVNDNDGTMMKYRSMLTEFLRGVKELLAQMTNNGKPMPRRPNEGKLRGM
jgi:hypothetical protein